jgi:ABC-type branched-subunit amino acid transport system ATPase component
MTTPQPATTATPAPGDVVLWRADLGNRPTDRRLRIGVVSVVRGRNVRTREGCMEKLAVCWVLPHLPPAWPKMGGMVFEMYHSLTIAEAMAVLAQAGVDVSFLDGK